MKNRKAIQDLIIKRLDHLTTSSLNKEIYTKRFKEMTDKEFKAWAEALKAGKARIAVYSPNDNSYANMERCFAYMESRGHPLRQRLRVPATTNVPEHETLAEHVVMMCFVRRQSQTFTKKVSTAKHDRSIDAATGQPTGASSPTSISAPENRILTGIGLKYTAREFNKIRGGDVGAYAAYKYMLETHGKVSQQAIEPYATGRGSVNFVKAWMASRHIGTNL